MFYLIYHSVATRLLTYEELSALHTDAMTGNATRGVTGVLLYRGGCFMQLIEGEEAVVRGLYEKIKADTRHRNVRVIEEGTREQRVFSRWSMGFVNLDRVPDKDVIKESLASPRFGTEAGLARRLLESFAE